MRRLLFCYAFPMSDIEFAWGQTVEGADSGQIADWIEQKLRAALDAAPRTDIAIAVPGGSTPFPIFELLAKTNLDWSRIAIWPTDDRIVSEDHAASNTGKIRAIFEPVGARVVALELDAKVPAFFLVWLGMGTDGHIASLFPNTDPQGFDPLNVRRLTPDPLPPEAPFDRITLTIPALVNSDELIFTLGGSAEKRALFAAASREENDLPIARLLGEADALLSAHITCFT